MDFGASVFLDYVGLRKDLRAVIRMHAGQIGAWQRFPSLPLQSRQCRRRGRDLVPDMKWGVGFLCLVNRPPAVW